jgi:hypothetical protein
LGGDPFLLSEQTFACIALAHGLNAEIAGVGVDCTAFVYLVAASRAHDEVEVHEPFAGDDGSREPCGLSGQLRTKITQVDKLVPCPRRLCAKLDEVLLTCLQAVSEIGSA